MRCFVAISVPEPLREALSAALEDGENALSAEAREAFSEGYERLLDMDRRLARYDQRISAMARRKLVSISPSGRAARDAAIDAMAPLVAEVVEEIGAERVRLALPVLRELRERLAKIDG